MTGYPSVMAKELSISEPRVRMVLSDLVQSEFVRKEDDAGLYILTDKGRMILRLWK
jgi:predicted transcriptional regulator